MSVRLNITIDEEVYRRLKNAVPPKKISDLINRAVRSRLYPDAITLAEAYKAAAREDWRRGFSDDWNRTEIESWPE
jgi:predicted CopG family antitoxin